MALVHRPAGCSGIDVIDHDRLVIEEDSRSIQRAADLSGVASAVLSFDYKRDNEFKEDGVALEISAGPTG